MNLGLSNTLPTKRNPIITDKDAIKRANIDTPLFEGAYQSLSSPSLLTLKKYITNRKNKDKISTAQLKAKREENMEETKGIKLC